MTEEIAIRVGIQTSVAAASWDLPFRFALAHRFSAFEWFPDRHQDGSGWSVADVSQAARARIRRLAATSHMRLSVHATLDATPLSAAGMQRLCGDIAFARAIGARLINLHVDLAAGAEALASALELPLQRLERAGITLALENTVSSGPGDLNELFGRCALAERVPGARVGICFDIGHANLFAATRNDYLAYLDAVSPRVPIVHLHLHENYGDSDSHLLLFSGPARERVDGLVWFFERLRQRGFVGAAILEQWPTPPSQLLEVRRRLHELVC